MPRGSPRYVRPLISLAVVAILTLSAAVPSAYLALPRLRPWWNLRHLASNDAALRDRSLRYLAAHADNDPRVFQRGINALAAADDPTFSMIVSALDHALTWRRPEVPVEPWLRWVDMLARSDSTDTRVLAANLLADLHPLAGDERVSSIIETLTHDPSPDVRYNALVAATELLGVLGSPDRSAPPNARYHRIIARLLDDPASAIARQAWIVLGLVQPLTPPHADWGRYADRPTVAHAMLVARQALEPEDPAHAIAALTAEDAPPAVHAAAAHALALSDAPAARAALEQWLAERSASNPAPADRLTRWRAILALAAIHSRSPTHPPALPQVRAFLRSRSTRELTDPSIQPLILAAIHADPLALMDRQTAAATDLPLAVTDPLAELAFLEGLARLHAQRSASEPSAQPPPSTPIHPRPDSHPHLQLAALALSPAIEPARLLPLLTSDLPTVREQALLLAAHRLSPQQAAALCRQLLLDFNDRAKCAGALLAGLTDARPTIQRASSDQHSVAADLLLDRHAALRGAYYRPVRLCIELALWMQHRPIDPDPSALAVGLLGRSDLPTTTVLLVLLHQRRPEAPDYLLTPRGDEIALPSPLPTADPTSPPDPVGLRELLADYRWWNVLAATLPGYTTPTTDPPPDFWLWADPELQQLQIDTLRTWWLMHRHPTATTPP